MTDADGTRRVGVLTPMPSELRPFVRTLSLEKGTRGDLPVHTGTLGDAEVVVATTGMGTVTARQTAERLIDAVQPDHVIVSGIAGGFATTKIRDLLVPETVVDGDTRQEFRATSLGGSPLAGRLITFGEFLTDAEVLGRLADEGFDAIDMETAAIAAVCQERGVPWTAFRAISDPAIEGPASGDVFKLVNPDGSPNLRAALRYMVTHPWRVPSLVRLARDATAAANSACAAARRAIAGG